MLTVEIDRLFFVKKWMFQIIKSFENLHIYLFLLDIYTGTVEFLIRYINILNLRCTSRILFYCDL